MSETLILNGKGLTLEDLYSVVYDRRPVQIAPEVIPLVDKSRQVLFDMAADGKPVYGLNHGVGWTFSSSTTATSSTAAPSALRRLPASKKCAR